ncbi:hypothetical protein GCM10010430_62930 [Kitasatospora cystarginea]|uniref:Transposase n=1 Tax=Kitasatospora cystarginea TaxID=58350 RepID=A0ABN3ERT0_9ACTN
MQPKPRPHAALPDLRRHPRVPPPLLEPVDLAGKVVTFDASAPPARRHPARGRLEDPRRQLALPMAGLCRTALAGRCDHVTAIDHQRPHPVRTLDLIKPAPCGCSRPKGWIRGVPDRNCFGSIRRHLTSVWRRAATFRVRYANGS